MSNKIVITEPLTELKKFVNKSLVGIVESRVLKLALES